MVTIIGAGLSGLSLAFHLQQAGIEYLLLESSPDAGGYIKTIQKNECTLELGPNSILCDDETLRFIKSIGLEKELLPANEVSKARFIYKKGRYRKLPDNPIKLLLSNFFSTSTKLKIAREPLAPIVEKQDETLADFFIRRFGQEVYDYALVPFATGIYAGDPKAILLEESFPVLKEYERKYGSVLKGFIKNKPARKQSYSFVKGMQSLPKAIAGALKNIQYNSKLIEIGKQERRLILKIESGGQVQDLTTDVLVITTPTFTTQDLLKDLYPDFSKALNTVKYPPMSAVHTVYHKSQVKHSLQGFGGLNPHIENLFSSGSIWSSSVFSGRCSEDKILFTNFVGGSLNADKTQLTDTIIKENVHAELAANFNISGKPIFQNHFKWDRSIPQYTKELKESKKYISEIERDNIFFCANWINGISLPDCIKKGKQLADKISKLEAVQSNEFFK